MEYVTAESYKNYKRVSEPYENKGKMYIKIWESCSRCGGSGYVQPWGTCFKCGGNKGQVKVVNGHHSRRTRKFSSLLISCIFLSALSATPLNR